jgi:hypothetical protein
MGVEKPWGKKGHTRGPVRYNDGVLELTLPKKTAAASKRLTIN